MERFAGFKNLRAITLHSGYMSTFFQTNAVNLRIYPSQLDNINQSCFISGKCIEESPRLTYAMAEFEIKNKRDRWYFCQIILLFDKMEW